MESYLNHVAQDFEARFPDVATLNNFRKCLQQPGMSAEEILTSPALLSAVVDHITHNPAAGKIDDAMCVLLFDWYQSRQRPLQGVLLSVLPAVAGEYLLRSSHTLGAQHQGFEACLIAVYAGNRKGEGDVAAPTGDRTADDAGGSSTANVRGEGGSNGAGLRGESATSHSSRAGVSTRRSPGSFTMPSVTSPSLYNHMGSLAPGAAPIVEGDPAMLMLSPTGQVHDNFMFFATNSLCHKYGNGRLAYTDLPTPSSLVKGIAASARPVLVGCALGRWLEELPHVPAASQLLFVRFCCSVASMGCSWAHATVVSPSHTAGSSSVFSHASSSLPGPAPSLPNGKPSTLTVTHLSSPPAGDGRTAVEHMVPLSHPLLNHMVEGLAFLFFSTQGSGAPAFGRPDGQDVPGTGDAEGGGNAGGGDDDALGALEAACRVAVQVLHKRALYDLAPDAILLTHSLARVVNKVGGGAARPVVHELSRG